MIQKFEQKLIELGFEFEKVERTGDDNFNMVFPDGEPWFEYYVDKSLSFDFFYSVSFAYCPGTNEFVLYIDTTPGFVEEENGELYIWTDNYGDCLDFTDKIIDSYTRENVEKLCIDYDNLPVEKDINIQDILDWLENIDFEMEYLDGDGQFDKELFIENFKNRFA